VIYLLGRDNRVYYYAHLSRFAVIQNGDRVKQNQIIARAGNSGNAWSTPTHLHFEIMTIPWLLPLVMKNINPYKSLIETDTYMCLLDSLNRRERIGGNRNTLRESTERI
jgi:murein DD-endopeptidase MepM/ murein hydrolase activator NlpD